GLSVLSWLPRGVQSSRLCACALLFFFDATAPSQIYTLSLHDALPISHCPRVAEGVLPRQAGLPALCPACERTLSERGPRAPVGTDRKSTRLNSSHVKISYAVFCLKKKKKQQHANGVRHDAVAGGTQRR